MIWHLPGFTSLVALLLAAAPGSANAKDRDGWTPLICAARGGYEDTVERLGWTVRPNSWICFLYFFGIFLSLNSWESPCSHHSTHCLTPIHSNDFKYIRLLTLPPNPEFGFRSVTVQKPKYLSQTGAKRLLWLATISTICGYWRSKPNEPANLFGSKWLLTSAVPPPPPKKKKLVVGLTTFPFIENGWNILKPAYGTGHVVLCLNH